MGLEFNETTLLILQASGWDNHRVVNISKYLDYYETTNQIASPIVKTFLKSFGGLTIKVDTKHPTIQRKIILNPIRGGESMGEDGLSFYQKWIDRTACIIGLSDNQTLLMTPNGAIYAVFDEYVFLKGETIQESLQTICSGRFGVKISSS